jgi:5-formyltetrahydrofolate cyclo-ligase
MNFYRWNYLDILIVNKYGMLEPKILEKQIIPDIILVPLLAFDSQNNRLGYGKGYYDIFLNKYLKKNKNIITIGVAFSFQKYNKLPVSNFDVSLNFILTEKGMA